MTRSPRVRRHARGTIVVAVVATLVVGAGAGAGRSAAQGVESAVVAPTESRAWIFSRLAEGDALLRRGRPRAAARVFRDVFAQTQGTQWGALAELGLAWSVASSGDAELGRALAADAHASGAAVVPTTQVVLALLNARVGDHAAATSQLEAAARTVTDPEGGRAIRLAQAYVRFWSDDFSGAAAAFGAVAASDPAGRFADDARYGAAWSHLRAGARALARDELAALVADAPAGHRFRSAPQRLIELDARAVLAAGTRGERRSPVRSPEEQLVRMLDADGFSRARSALRLLDAGRVGRAATAPGADAAAVPDAAAGAGVASGAHAPAAGVAASTPDRDAPRRDALRLALGILVLVALVVAGWLVTRWTERRGRFATPRVSR